jgi:60 kDa SS-A/Ro ribonucleoprotein
VPANLVAGAAHGSTAVMTQWQKFVTNQRKLDVANPKLVCIDLQPYATTLAQERTDILNVGGFSDAVCNLVASFLADEANRFVAEVEAIEL